jgi:hypothetical protein
MAFPTGWERKCAITIADTNVDGDLSNFTVVLNEDALPSEMFDADGSYPALEGGGDIRFSSDYDGANQLPCDIRAFHIDNDPANGYANIAVKVPSILASGGATIYVWYNKAGESQPAAADTYGQYNAYDGDFIGVWPLIESGNGTAGEFKDRTSNQINGQGGSGTGSKVPTQEDGDVYKRQSFDGTDDHVDLNNSGANDFNFVQNSLVFTWEGLIGIDNLSSRESIFRNTGSTAEKGFTLCWETNAAVGYDALRALIVKGSSGTPVIDCRSPDGTTITDTNPHHVAFRGNGSGNSVLFYVDGVQKATTVSTAFSSLSTGGTTNDTLWGVTVALRPSVGRWKKSGSRTSTDRLPGSRPRPTTSRTCPTSRQPAVRWTGTPPTRSRHRRTTVSSCSVLPRPPPSQDSSPRPPPGSGSSSERRPRPRARACSSSSSPTRPDSSSGPPVRAASPGSIDWRPLPAW